VIFDEMEEAFRPTGPSGSVTSGETRKRGSVGELLTDLEEDKAARAVVFELLAGMERDRP
jgi:hypothetical protein